MPAEVLRLVQRSNRETIETLEWMLEQARGDEQFDLCAWINNAGRELVVLTGSYKANRDKALGASMRLNRHLSDD